MRTNESFLTRIIVDSRGSKAQIRFDPLLSVSPPMTTTTCPSRLHEGFQVIPAIDLRGGRVVRLRQGDYARETVFRQDPVTLARRYAEGGARWLHVVDLDGARAGRFGNLDVIRAIAGDSGLRVQAGGGVRSAEDVERLYAAGVARVVVGSLAVTDPATTIRWLQRFGPERITLALDVRRRGDAWCLPVRGWTVDAEVGFDALLACYVRAGARHVLCTDVARDGTLAGFNLDLYRYLQGLAPSLAVQASGGVRSIDDIRAARAVGACGVVLGRALLEGRFGLQDALQC